ncbi:hypothetical protein LZQ00_04685 [Sphingobacterium sp. SRCM116780]|uniref:hypothetical protein n=1 Tax=Sphingobacterium sp. SRCM116780 TaxID=2907623 RepID=UPI001F363370|nr:hypothetical protein [Sphingobacterium sp. SRCM116780]UIR57112.1 hypothetical protein LZQ00_04685 [Sphingobacterium sp. SRCM116780]
MKYDVEIFDVKGNIPKFPYLNLFYKKDKWKDFWHLINFTRKNYPQYFVIQNIHELRNKNKGLGDKIDELIILYDHKMRKNHFVLYDFHEKLNTEEFYSIFLDSPLSFGLRGDPELWAELTEYFKGKPFPKDEDELVELIEIAFIELTGKSIHQSEDYFVEKYYHGSGMSGGMISQKFWIHTAIPILIGRYERIKNFC